MARGPRELLLATHNDHKRREFERLLAQDGSARWSLAMLPDELALPPEVGETFAENALDKARAAAGSCARASIADDSGIAAAALGGRPGVRSARYAGERASDRGEPGEAASARRRRGARSSTSA